MELQDLITRFDNVKEKPAGGYRVRCPAHDDKNPSLDITLVDNKILMHCYAGCQTKDILAAVNLTEHDLFNDNGRSRKDYDRTPHREVPNTTAKRKQYRTAQPFLHPEFGMPVKKYPYRDESGQLLYYICRFEGEAVKALIGKNKTMRPCTADGWRYGIGDTRRVLYRLPEIMKAVDMILSEGEKDVDTVAAMGFDAAGFAFGAGSFEAGGYADSLSKKNIFILPDNDESGRKMVRTVAHNLNGVAASVRVLDIEGMQPGWDITDYFNEWRADVTTAAIKTAMAQAVEYKPEPCQVEVAGEALGLHEMKDAVSTTDVCFLWKEYVPAAMPFIIYAREGAGKTTIALFICKEILKAYPEGTILWIAAEGATLDTLDKALKMGLPEERFRFVRKTGNKTGGFRFNLRNKKDRDILDGIISNHNTQGNILAVITDSIRGGIGDENDSSAGKIMQDVNEIVCDKHGLACGYIHHENKSTTADARDKMSGGTTISAAVRHTFRIIETKSAYRRILRVIKSNLREPKSVTRLSAIKVSDNTMLFKDLKKSEEIKKASAEKFLLGLFAANELKPLRARFIFTQGEEAGFNKDNLQDAKRELAIKSFRYSGGTAPWYWRIKDE